MYLSKSGLPHLLPPRAYGDRDWAEQERASVLSTAWHCVALESDLSSHGDFITLDLLGEPILIRNFDGEIVALSNVCAHRHCLIQSRHKGHDKALRCQYHGWEYGSDGRTRKIPKARDFAPIDREKLCVKKYEVDSVGQLLFVRCNPNGPDLRSWLGPIAVKLEERFGPDWRCFLRSEKTYDANWKVTIENALEAYHVDYVHSQTFGEGPSEERCEHTLDQGHSSFTTDLPFASHSRMDLAFQKSEGWVAKRLGKTPTYRYWHHHCFPNLLYSYTDSISLLHTVIPLSPTRSRSLLLQSSFVPRQAGLFRKSLARVWGLLESQVTQRILQEDFALVPEIQKGLSASRMEGCLSRAEERIHHFQNYLLNNMQKNSEDRTNSRSDT